MNELKNRFKQLAEYYGVSMRKLEAKFNLQRGNISNLTGAIGSDKLSKIYDANPEINLTWLITGNEKMIVSNEISNDSATELNDITVNAILDRLEFLAAENALLKDKIEYLKREKKPQSMIVRDIAAESNYKVETYKKKMK